MGRIDALPPDIRRRLHELLQSGVSQADILRRLEPLLEAEGEAPLSRSGLNRYAARMERVGRRIRETRAAAEAWTRQFGDRAGDVSGHAIDLIRTLLAEASLRQAENPDVPLETLSDLALAVQRLERAAGSHAARERALRAEIAARAADAGEKAGVRQGLSPEGAAAIRAAIEGAA